MKQFLLRQLCHTLLLGVLVILCLDPTAGLLRGADAGKDDEDVTNIFLPAPRGLRQQLTRARKALEEEQYSEAVDLLGQLLASPEAGADARNGVGEQDYFMGGVPQPGTQVSLKTEAQRLLGGMPDKGRDLYELKFGADARQLLDTALEKRDIQQLIEVTRRYFHTQAGYEATMLIGRHYLDQGRPLAAALCFQRLSGSDYALKRYDPELSVLLATCWLLADMPDRAREQLLRLNSRAPESKLRIGDTTVSLFDDADETLAALTIPAGGSSAMPTDVTDRVLAWLEQIIGPEFAAGSREATQWVMYRGDPSRNAESAGGTPLLSARWRVQTANHPTDEEFIRQGRKQFLDRGVPAIPSISPLAVADVIVMRTPRRLMGVDFETGKRIWEFPWYEVSAEETLQNDRIRPRSQALNPEALELSQRMWDDAPYGQVSSDGRQVFVLWGLSTGTSQPSVIIQQFGIQRPNDAGSTDSNKLVSLEIKAEGKLRWIVGDEDGTDEPKLAGAFFLGPPLPLMGQLYVMAEINGEIRLVVLDAETGHLQWSQQLAHVDARDIGSDPGRRSAGASPSFSDGVLICPTSSGAVVAVDISTRSLLWGYQYPMAGTPTRVSMSGFRYTPKEIGDRWADATVTIADGRVLVTPVEADQLYCLDLITGEPVWEPLARDTMLYTGGVVDGNAIMVGKKDVKAIAINDGHIVWTRELPAGVPSGRGMLSGHQYYLPTSADRLLKIDVKTGDIVEDIATDLTLGNLVAYKDQVISLNVDWLAAYYQTEPLRQIVADRLAANPSDGWALARQAELLLHDGRHGEALEVFQRAYKLNPEDDSIRASLVRSLLAALRDDFPSNQTYAVELENLIDQRAEQAEFCRWMAVGSKKQGDLPQALQYFIRLAAMETATGFGADADEASMVRVDGQLQVRRDRWLRVQIQQLFAEADGPARQQLDELIRVHYDEMARSQTPTKLRDFVEHFSGRPIGLTARMDLARSFLERGHLLAAEGELIALQQADEPVMAATATAMLAKMLLEQNKLQEAAACYQQLATDWGAVATLDGPTGKQLADAAHENNALRKMFDKPVSWLRGKCEVSEEPKGSFPTYLRLFPIELTDITGPFPTDYTLVHNPNQNCVMLSDAYGSVVQNVLLGDTNRFVTTNATAGRAAARGHLVVLNVGFEVMAIDTLRGGDQQGDVVLWRTDLSNSLILAAGRTRQLMSNTITRKWGPPRYIPSEGRLGPIGTAGPVTRQGVVFQKMQELTCADPLTGESIWVRSGIEPGSDVFGDDEYLFVVGPTATEAIVVSTADGTEVGRRPVASRAERWLTSGRCVLACRPDGNNLRIRWFDAWSQTDVWTRDFSNDAQCWQPSRDTVAVLQPEGDFVVLNVADGQERVAAKLDPEPDLDRLYVLASRDLYMVVASSKNSNSASSRLRLYGSIGTEQCPEINGHVYAIDRESGKPLWPVPAEIREYNLPLDQAVEAPTLVFFRHTQTQASANSPRTSFQAAVLCIDKRDGRELLANDGLAMIRSYGVEASPENQSVSIKTNSKNFLLKFTDQPVEPATPVQMKAPQTSSNNAMKNVGKIANAILEAITEKQKSEPAKTPPAANQEKAPAKENGDTQKVPSKPPSKPDTQPAKKEKNQ